MNGLSLSDKVTLGTALLGAMAGTVGSFAVLRRRALVGDMLAHAALPGVCIAFLLAESRELVTLSAGALVSGLIAIGLVTLVTRWTRTREDAAIGIALTTFFGLGVVLLSGISRGRLGGISSGLDAYLFGEPGNMLTGDLKVLAVVGLLVALVTVLLFKEFKLTSFDNDFAQSQGWPTLWLDLGMMGMVAVVTIVGLPIVGVILMAAMLIIPPATARMWTNQLWVLVWLAAGLGVAAGVLGTRLAPNLPAGPAIVLAAAGLFTFSLLFAPRRGVLARGWAEIQMRLRVGEDHLLRALYELSEERLPEPTPIPAQMVRAHRTWQPWVLKWLLSRGEREGLMFTSQDTIRLTPLGIQRAADATRTHRLWELYMMQYVGSAADHVDRSADDVEHTLPESLKLELERILAAQGRLPPAAIEVPASPHDPTQSPGA
jgi:manganese/zinc/iron transport system permease protein